MKETDLTIPTIWYDPEGRVPDMYTPATYEEFGVGLQSQSLGSQGSLFYVLINSTIYSEIESSVTQYVTDLQWEGYSVNVHTISGGTPEEIRSLLASAVPDGLVGVLFVGDIPEAWYEMDNPSPWGHEEFPIDLFYMDLNGTWIDSDGDNIYDGHGGDVAPEIYVGRLKASNIDGDEVSLINDYFEKIHNYRIGSLSLPERALVYVDDDWVYWADDDNAALQLIYDETTLVKDEATTNATDYKKRITEGTGYEWVHLRCHGSPYSHTFKILGQWDGTVSWQDYRTMNPKAMFYQLFVCSATRYTSPNNLGGTIAFATSYGVLVVGSTKTGSMLYFSDFYGPISEGKSIGKAFQEWFIKNGESDPKWFYGLTIIGDPILEVVEPLPVRNIDTGLDYSTIQGAIDAPETLDGHTIRVDAGTYYESVAVDKSLTLVGEDLNTTIIDGNGTRTVVYVTASQVSISGFTIRNGEWVCLSIDSSENTITENRISTVKYGIYLSDSQKSTVTNNVISETTYTGIFLTWHSHNNTVSNNTISGPSYGIYLDGGYGCCQDNTVSYNNITQISGEGIYLYNCNNTLIKGNLIDGGEWTSGIYLSYFDYNNTILQNTALNNWCGIFVGNSDGNLVAENVVQDNKYGIYVRYVANNTVRGNTVSGNQRGIRLSNSEGNLIIESVMENNTYGIHMDNANNNTVYRNDFIDNTNQVYTDQSVNTWDNGAEGNHWSDYDGTDANKDGIGDTPYIIDENNQDNYPLMHPWGSIRNIDTGLIYLTIQKAINAPETLGGHTIQVAAGTYDEGVTLNKSLTLAGENRDATIIDGNGADEVIYVTANGVTIKEFTIRNGDIGVDVSFSNRTYIINNAIGYNDIGVLLNSDSIDNLVSSNTFQNNLWGIVLASQSQYNTIGNNVVSSNSYGIRLDMGTSNNTLYYNNIAFNTEYGIAVIGCTSENHICHNYISNNDRGIYLEYASNQEIRSNEISNNQFGMYLFHSDNNVVYRNNFIDNSVQVKSIKSVNIWDDGFASEGNYWSDYTGEDLDGDGIGDTPYVIDSKNQDNYPLMNPRSPIIGDVDGDWDVDTDDLNIMSEHWATHYPTWDPYWGPRCDIAGPYYRFILPIPDGFVDIDDLMTLSTHWGDTWPPP